MHSTCARGGNPSDREIEERLFARSLLGTGVSLRDKGKHAILLKAFLELIGQAAWRTAHTAAFMNAWNRAPQDKNRRDATEKEHVALQEHMMPDSMYFNLLSGLASSSPRPSDLPVCSSGRVAILPPERVICSWIEIVHEP